VISQQQLLQHLDMYQIVYQLYTHEPLFTCQQALQVVKELNMPGTGVKNLFLQDDKKIFYLVVAVYTTRIDLKQIKKTMGAKDLRFADAAMLKQHLGVKPGSVTPLALINDEQCVVQVIIDAELFAQEYIQIHPLSNDATVVMRPTGLEAFLISINRCYTIYS
jgi:Ala-tRNA(Pro) deacylase